MLRLLLLSLLFYSQSSFAFEKSLFIGAGFLSKNVATLTGSDSGEPGFLTSNFFQLVFSGFFKLSDSLAFAPTISATPLGPGSPERGESYRVFTIVPRFAFETGSSNGFDLHGGPGIQVYQIMGAGGTAVVNNGTTPVNFPLPNSIAHSITMLVDLGFGIEKESMRLDLDIFMTGLINRRTTNIILSISYGIS